MNKQKKSVKSSVTRTMASFLVAAMAVLQMPFAAFKPIVAHAATTDITEKYTWTVNKNIVDDASKMGDSLHKYWFGGNAFGRMFGGTDNAWYLLDLDGGWANQSLSTAYGSGATDGTATGDYYYQKILTYGEAVYQNYLPNVLHGAEYDMIMERKTPISTSDSDAYMDTLVAKTVYNEMYATEIGKTTSSYMQGGNVVTLTNSANNFKWAKSQSGNNGNLLVRIDSAADPLVGTINASNAYIITGAHVYAPSFDEITYTGNNFSSGIMTRTFAGKKNDLFAYRDSASKSDIENGSTSDYSRIDTAEPFYAMLQLDVNKAFFMRNVWSQNYIKGESNFEYYKYWGNEAGDELKKFEFSDNANYTSGYKFVVPNNNLSGVSFSIDEKAQVKAGNTVEISYTNAKTTPVDTTVAGANAPATLYISAAIINDSGVMLYYRPLQEVTSSRGTVKLTIPAEAATDENVKICIFEEQQNRICTADGTKVVDYVLSDYVSDVYVVANGPITSVYDDYSAKECVYTDEYGTEWHYQLDKDGNAINVYITSDRLPQTEYAGVNYSGQAQVINETTTNISQNEFIAGQIDAYEVPRYINGHKIVSIGGGKEDKPFVKWNAALSTTIVLPDTITEINDCAFYWHPSNTNTNHMRGFIANTVTKVGTKAFYGANPTYVRIANLTGTIGYRAFANNTYAVATTAENYVSDNIVWITGGDENASVSEYAFENSSGIGQLILDGTLSIKNNAFKDTGSSVKSTIGTSVKFEGSVQEAGLYTTSAPTASDEKRLECFYTGQSILVGDGIDATITKDDFKVNYINGTSISEITDKDKIVILYYGINASPSSSPIVNDVRSGEKSIPVTITKEDLNGKNKYGAVFAAAYWYDDDHFVYQLFTVMIDTDDSLHQEVLIDEYGTYAGIRKGINDLNDEIDAKAAEITTLTERITELEAAGNNDAEVTELRNQLSTARSDLNALQSRYDTLDAALTAYKTAHQETGIGYMGKDRDGNDVVYLDGVPYQYDPSSVQDYELGGHTFKMYTGTGDPLGTGDTTFRFYVTEGSEAVHVLSGDGSEAVYTQTLWDMIYEADKELADAQDSLTTLQNGLDEVIDVLKNAGIDVDLDDNATDAETVAKVKESVQELVTDYTAVKDDYAAIKEEIFNGTADGKTRQETIDALHDLYEKTSDVVKQLEEAIGTTSEGDDKEALKKLLDQIQKMKEGVGSDLSVIEEINKSLNITDANEAVSTIQSLYRQIATLQAQVNDLSKENGNLKNQVASLQSASTPGSHTEYITQNDPKILDQNAALSADNQTLLKAYNELVEAYNFLMAKSNGQQDQITSLESDNSDLRNQVATLEKRPTSGSSIAQTGNSQTIVVEEEKEDQGEVELIEPSEPTEPETETETEPEEYTMAGKEMSYLAEILEMEGMTDQELYEYLQNGMAEEGYEDEEEYLIHLLMDKYGITAKAASDMLHNRVAPAPVIEEAETIETETETETASAEVVIEEDDGGVDTTKLAMMIAGGAAVVGGAGAGTVLLLKKGRIRGRKPSKASGNENAEEDALDVDTDEEDEEDSSDDEEDEDEDDDDDEEYEDDDSDDEESDDEEE